jgi:hypothetical protein
MASSNEGMDSNFNPSLIDLNCKNNLAKPLCGGYIKEVGLEYTKVSYMAKKVFVRPFGITFSAKKRWLGVIGAQASKTRRHKEYD